MTTTARTPAQELDRADRRLLRELAYAAQQLEQEKALLATTPDAFRAQRVATTSTVLETFRKAAHATGTAQRCRVLFKLALDGDDDGLF